MNLKMNLNEDKILKKENYYLYYMSQKDIKNLKEIIWKKNNKKCPVLNKEIPLNKMVLDHKHKLKSEESNKELGACREALEFRVNAMAGKIENMFKRYGFHKEDVSLPNLLRSIADYLERGSYKESFEDSEIYFIHPNEVPKRKKISKRDLNLINKYYFYFYPRKRKIQRFIYETEESQRLLNEIKSWDKEKKKEADKFIKNLKNIKKDKE